MSQSFGNLCLTAIECTAAETPGEKVAAITAYNISTSNRQVNLSGVSGNKFRHNVEQLLEPHASRLASHAGDMDALRSMAKRLSTVDVVIGSQKDNPTLDAGRLEAAMPQFFQQVEKKHHITVKTVSDNVSGSMPGPATSSLPKAPDPTLQRLSAQFLRENPIPEGVSVGGAATEVATGSKVEQVLAARGQGPTVRSGGIV